MSIKTAQPPLFSNGLEVSSEGGAYEDATNALLGLSTVKGLGRKGLRALFERCDGRLEKVLVTSKYDASLEETLKEAHVPSASKIAATICTTAEEVLTRGQKERENLTARGINVFVSFSQSDLPERLKAIPDPPYWLFVEGDPQPLFQAPSVAVVGTRKPTEKGIKAAQTVAKLMGTYPLTLVSGLAEGIDEAAHRASLEEGIKNVAFLGHGINHVFPEKTRDLREMIVADGGAVASEYFPNEKYQKSYFVERNRLQAALAHLVIPVEAQAKSGTAHTLRFAKKYGRPVVGLHWHNGQVNGLAELIRQEGHQMVDIFSGQGWRDLDRVFRDLAEAHGQATFALTQVVRSLAAQMRSRTIKKEDVDMLRKVLDDLEKEGLGESNP